MKRSWMHAGLALAGLVVGGACSLELGGLPVVDGGEPTDAPSDVASDVILADTLVVDSSFPSDASDASKVIPPGSLAGLELWFVADKGVMLDGGVTNWVDQSGKGDTARNAFPAKLDAPTVIDAGFGPALSFSATQGLETGQWDGGVSVPFTVFVLAGKDVGAPAPNYVFSSLNVNSQIGLIAFTDNRIYPYAGAFGTPATGLVSKPMALVGVFNGPSTFLLRNANPGDAGMSSAGVNTFAPGLVIGNYAPNGLGLSGYIAEFALFSRVLTDQEIVGLNAYAAQRYGVVIQ